MLKKKQIIFYLFLAGILAFSSCKSDDSSDPEPQRTLADVEADFQALDLSPGTHDVSIELPNGTSWVFRYIAPERAAGENRPFILDLHGAPGGNPSPHTSTACYIEPGLASLDAFILSPNGGAGLWYDEFNQEQVAIFITFVKKHWPIELDKMAVTGYSNGGNGSWFYGEFQASTLSAAIPMASSYDVYGLDSTVSVIDIPMYVIHGENDELFPLAETQGWVEASVNAGSDITFVIAPGLGHYTPCDYVPYLQDAALWLRDSVWME